MAQHEPAQHARLVDKFSRGDHVADAQARREALGERSDVDHGMVLVHRLERRGRRADEVRLRFVIVLDDGEPVAARLFQEGHAALHGHGDRRRRLVAGGHVDAVAALDRAVDHHAVLVNRDRLQFGVGQREDVARIDVARVLQADRRFGPSQELGDEIKGVLRAHGDQDLGMGRAHAAPRQHAGAHLLDEQRIVHVEAVLGPAVDRLHAERLARAHAPRRHGKQVRIRLPIDERVRIAPPVLGLGELLPRRRLELKAARPIRGIPVIGYVVLGAVRRGPGGQHLGVHEVTDPLARGQEALVRQRLVGEHHRVARYTQRMSQPAARRQRVIHR